VEHAEIGGSAAERIIACAGSVRESRGKPDRTSSYAIQGTAAHDVAAQCLRDERLPEEFLDRFIEVIEGEGADQSIHLVPVDEEMVNGLQVYLDVCHDLAGWGFDPTLKIFIEHRVDINELLPAYPKPLFGFDDYAVYNPSTRRLTVVDFKYGYLFVDPNTAQLKYYALGLLLQLKDEQVDEVELVIVQPRSSHGEGGPVRREIIQVAALLDWLDEVFAPAVMKTEEPDAPLVAGPHCIHCRAAGECKTLREHALNSALVMFEPLDAMPIPGAALQEPNTLTTAQVAHLLEFTDVFMLWARSFREYAFHLLNSGIEVEGWKIVARQGRRRWVGHPDQTVSDLVFMFGVPQDVLWNQKLKSPAQMETSLRKAFPTGKARDIILDMRLSGLWETPVTGTTLARTDDPRTEVMGVDVVGFERLDPP
jgi:hypothetical protein